MKKVRIFMAASLLAIAGIAAAATALKQVDEDIYYVSGSQFFDAGQKSLACQPGGIDCKITNPANGQLVQAYVYRVGEGYVSLEKDPQ